MATVNYYLKSGKSDERQIYLRVFHRGKGFKDYTPFSVNVEKWNPRVDKKTKKHYWLKGQDQESKEIENWLRERRNKALDLFDELTTLDGFGNNIEPSILFFKERYYETFPKEKSKSQPFEKKEEVQSKNITSNSLTLIDLVNQYLEVKKSDMVYKTGENYRSLNYHLLNFKNRSGHELNISELNIVFWDQFKNYLIERKENGGAFVVNSTAQKYLKRIRTVLNYFQGVYEFNPILLNTRIATTPSFETDIHWVEYERLDKLKSIDFRQKILEEYLSRFDNVSESFNTNELSRLMNIKTSSILNLIKNFNLPAMRLSENTPYFFSKSKVVEWIKKYEWCENKETLDSQVKAYSIARDSYLFASYCPLRHEDLIRMTSSNIKTRKTANGDYVYGLDFDPIKGMKYGIHVFAPMNDYCMDLVRKYEGKTKDNRLLPTLKDSNKLSNNVHQMLKYSGLFNETFRVNEYRGSQRITVEKQEWEMLHFHTSRHNFATNLIELVPEKYIAEVMGHKDTSTLKKYQHTNKRKVAAMVYNAISQDVISLSA